MNGQLGMNGAFAVALVTRITKSVWEQDQEIESVKIKMVGTHGIVIVKLAKKMITQIVIKHANLRMS